MSGQGSSSMPQVHHTLYCADVNSLSTAPVDLCRLCFSVGPFVDNIRHMDDPDARNLVMPSAGQSV